MKVDVAIFGATCAGVVAAIQCARSGKTVALVAQGTHVGGMCTNGLGWVDLKDSTIIGGITKEYFHNLWQYYEQDANWTREPKKHIAGQLGKYNPHSQTCWSFEPHVAEKILHDMLKKEQHVFLLLNFPVILQVQKQDEKVQHVLFSSSDGATTAFVNSDFFMDCSYEGDLMASIGISSTTGREANGKYHEQHNGCVFPNHEKHTINVPISPYDNNGQLLPQISSGQFTEGEEDASIQSFCFRLCMTDDKDNMVPVQKPGTYNEKDFELLLRAVEAGTPKDNLLNMRELPNHKWDVNNGGAISLDYIAGNSTSWITATSQERQKLYSKYVDYTIGFIWTLQNHSRVPKEYRDYFNKFGWCRDEFTDNKNIPYEVYVREGRRMISDTIITEQMIVSSVKNDTDVSLCLGFYNIDSHICRYVVNKDTGNVGTEGGTFVFVPEPFSIPYGAVVPKRSEATNVLVPVCLSASHIAFCAIRMECIWMAIAQSCALAVVLASESKCNVQDVPRDKLKDMINKAGQVLKVPQFYIQRMVHSSATL
jgi:hypothetical protein